MKLYCFDFDGVLCDSAMETAVTAWRASRKIWTPINNQYRNNSEPPAELMARFIKLRPVIESGYQCIFLMRLIESGIANDVIMREFLRLCDEMQTTLDGMNREECTRLFNDTRKHWIDQDFDGWLNMHRFYQPALQGFIHLTANSTVYILTTKSEVFVKLLLASRDVKFPDHQLFGLERHQTKEQVLAQIITRPEYQAASIIFVEDRLATLKRMVGKVEFKCVRLYLADWGYNTQADRKEADSISGISVCSQDYFMKAV